MRNKANKPNVSSLTLNLEKIKHLDIEAHKADQREYTDDTGCPTCPGVNSCLVC